MQTRRGQDDLMMDAAARAELAALRRRAYSRDADIAGDSVALKRLAELEELALPARLEAALVQPRSAGIAEAGAPTSGPVTGAGPPAVGHLPPRRRMIVGLVGAVAVLTGAVGVVAALQRVPVPTRPDAATAAPTARPAGTDLTAKEPVIIPLLIDSLRGEFIDFSERPDVPRFLGDGMTSWMQPLGVYYGWALWVAGVTSEHGPENCLLLTDGTATEAKCLPLEATADGALRVSLAYDRLAESERPLGMAPDQAVTFDWGGGAYVTMEVAQSR